MSKQYAEVQMWVAGAGDTDHVILKTDTLEGDPDTVTISIELEKDKEQIVGYFDIDQLLDALNVIKLANKTMPFIK